MAHRELNEWQLIYTSREPDHQRLHEALCTLGNGYFSVRGAAEEAEAGETDYPGTYLAGGYDRLETRISGRVIENEDLVNWPNPLVLSFRTENDEWFDLDDVEILSFRQTLDLRQGLLERRIQFRHSDDQETTLRIRRLVHMANPHLAAIEWALVPENWSGRIEVRSGIDGAVINAGVERYKDLSSRHLDVLETGTIGEDGIYLTARTKQSKIAMTQGVRTQ
ncbi:MAG: glycoside hydrolase family 65 protein, partial [Candidatus Latescibacteria bacterium]|nr:glycoside hydrolase family 65 protein [Candidatus Latescibacterota bacterium]